jgi:hypothetical protein
MRMSEWSVVSNQNNVFDFLFCFDGKVLWASILIVILDQLVEMNWHLSKIRGDKPSDPQLYPKCMLA